MFYDNGHFFAFVDECRERDIDVPIIPGLRILSNVRQLTSFPRTFHCEIPTALTDEVESAPGHARDIGIAWATEQARELLDSGCPSLRFFVLSRSKSVNAVLAKLDV